LADELRAIYHEGYFTEQLAQHSSDLLGAAAWRAAVTNARRRLPLIRRFAPRARRLLDLGCGTGAFLSVARDDYDCCGVDVSAEAITVVRERLGVEGYAGDIRSLDLAAGSFDVITLFDVVEHVPGPADLLSAVRRLLSAKGIVVLTTGDTDSLLCQLSGRWWHLMTPPEHLTFFSRAGLAQMVVRCGLTVRHVSHQPVVANVGYMAAKLADVVGAPLRWLPGLIGRTGLARLDLDVNLLDVVTLVARRA
jgi:SAM-dependent methyltransferase